MSKLLIQLLGVSERDFSTFIKRLESVCLNPGVDIRLSTEIKAKTQHKIKDLGLDPSDTTGREFFYALRSRLKEDDKKLKDLLKVNNKNPEQIAKIFAKYASGLCSDDQVLCMTAAGTKRVLTAVPPRKTMKALKLRSLESVLKREDPKVLFSISLLLEDESWLSQVQAKMKRLHARDIAWQTLTVSSIPSKWLEKIQEKVVLKGLSISCPQVGAVIAIPIIEKLVPGATVLAIGHLLQSAHKLCIESMPFRSHGLTRGYESVLMDISLKKQHELVSIHGIVPSWTVVYELVGSGRLKTQDTLGDMTIKELSWQSIELKLATLLDAFDFWIDTHYLALADSEGVTSMHILDVARALVLSHSYEQKSNMHVERSLWNELQIRYLQQDNLSRALIKQLQPELGGMVL